MKKQRLDLFSETLRLAFVQQGAGRPFLILHGGDGPGSWTAFTSELAARSCSLMPIHPGFDGEPRPEWFTRDDLVLAYLTLLERLDLRDVVVVGNSFGGWLPADFTRPFNVVLVNRGAWCPFCVAQLKSFQAGLSKLAQEGIGVVSFSADTKEKASAVVAENAIDFAVGYGVSVDAVAEALGVYYDPKPAHTAPYLHSAGFVLGPGAKILNAVYSSGAIGRLAWQDVLGLVQYVKAHS